MYFQNFSKSVKILTRVNFIRLSPPKCQYSSSKHGNGDPKKKIRIGCASGFWGDTPTAVPQLVHYGKLDFLVFDYLSEITMSLLVAARRKMPDLGYTPDFVHFAMAPQLAAIKEKGIRVISNAGGINPVGCAEALKEVAKSMDIDLKVAVVTGDDLTLQKEAMKNEGIVDMRSKMPLPDNLYSLNAYLGAGPIAKCLDLGADVVITGRCVDSAVTLGPIMHTFRNKAADLDFLAAGSLAGHLIECGAQSTGGIFTDWHLVSGWDNMGFPVIEFYENGDFMLTKPPKTGGLVTTATCSEQLVYEIDDPRNYLLPDVTCDFSNVKMEQIGENQVLINGAKGKSPSKYYKVSATYPDGYRLSGAAPVAGPNARKKAEKTAEAILNRTRRILKFLGVEDFRRTHAEAIGSGAVYKPQPPLKDDSQEVVMWLAVHHNEKRPLELLAREIAASATGAAPGLTSMAGGRPKPSPLIRLFSFLYPKDKLKIKITLNEHSEDYTSNIPVHEETKSSTTENIKEGNLLTGSQTYKIIDLAYTRSGDKGNTANIGVIARKPEYYQYLLKHLTTKVVAENFAHLFDDCKNPEEKIKRHTLPGIWGLNFVLEDALGGGGVSSLRSDPQGKALGQLMLNVELKNLPKLDEMKM